MSESFHTTQDEIKSFADIHEYKGLWSWVTSVDHKQIGIMYILSALLFLIVGVAEAVMMRIQLAKPMNDFLTPDMYNQIFTMHGTTMVFLMGMPLLFGFMVYFTPLMIGARDMAFPRLNALGYWLFMFSGLMMYFSFIAGGAADYISMCRPFIREPGLIKRWQSGDTVPAKCKSDNLCFGPAMKGQGILCVVEENEKSPA